MEATREKYDYKKAKERKKKFVRYKEGAELYSMGMTKFQEMGQMTISLKIPPSALVLELAFCWLLGLLFYAPFLPFFLLFLLLSHLSFFPFRPPSCD